MKYVYGPVRSRRLGNSLGITTVPYKVCNFDCVYCQLKKTTRKTASRKDYVRAEDILEEIRSFFVHKSPEMTIDCVTFSGSGEPTLNKSIGRLIRQVKDLTRLPVVLITNSSTLIHESVRRQLLLADLIIPSLDAVTQDVFARIDRPQRGLKIKDIIRSLEVLRKEFKGLIWLEIMLVRGLNDSEEYLLKMKEVIERIKPDKVQLNTCVRPPAQAWVKPPTMKTLKKASLILGGICEVV